MSYKISLERVYLKTSQTVLLVIYYEATENGEINIKSYKYTFSLLTSTKEEGISDRECHITVKSSGSL